MRIKINGQEQELKDASTLEILAKQKQLIKNNIVMELNGDIIPLEQWSETALKKGDVLEIISFVGGG